MTIAATLWQSLEARKKYITQNSLEAYRLITQKEAELPLAIDMYGDNAVIHVFDEVPNVQLKELENAVTSLLSTKNFFYKNRRQSRQNGFANQQALQCLPNNAAKLHLPCPHGTTIIIREYGHKFFINLSDYLDCGLFLDHRETRKWIKTKSKGKTVLNMFAYTGSFSIYAAAGGAAKTYSVDLSAPYCAWIKKNLQLNHLAAEKNWVYKMDAFEFLKYAKRKHLRFDIIILDPPTFSRNKNKNFSVERDHSRLIQEARELLNKNGFILFSNNFEEFRLNRSALPLAKIKEKTNTVPLDFGNSFAHWCWIIS